MTFKSLSKASLIIKIRTVAINTFLPTRTKCVYSYSIKICASGFNKLLESVFCLLLVVEVVSLQKLSKCWKKWLARGQVNTADEAKLCSPIRPTFEALVVWPVVGHCCGEELGTFC